MPTSAVTAVVVVTAKAAAAAAEAAAAEAAAAEEAAAEAAAAEAAAALKQPPLCARKIRHELDVQLCYARAGRKHCGPSRLLAKQVASTTGRKHYGPSLPPKIRHELDVTQSATLLCTRVGPASPARGVTRTSQ